MALTLKKRIFNAGAPDFVNYRNMLNYGVFRKAIFWYLLYKKFTIFYIIIKWFCKNTKISPTLVFSGGWLRPTGRMLDGT
jgi:hypothetical protein